MDSKITCVQFVNRIYVQIRSLQVSPKLTKAYTKEHNKQKLKQIKEKIECIEFSINKRKN